MATNSSTPIVPEANIEVPDESKSSSNGGINMALGLTVLLSLACIIWAALSVPKWNFDGDKTRPEIIRQNANLRDPNTLAPGTKGGFVLQGKGNEHDGDKNYVNGQAVTGDTITSGPGAPPAQPEKTGGRGTQQDERGGVTSNSGTQQ